MTDNHCLFILSMIGVAVISWNLAMFRVRRKIRRVFEEIKREL